MATLQLKGIVKTVFPVEYVGENKLAKQSIILFVPGWTDEFGDKKGQDEEWELQAIGDKIPGLALAPDKVDKKMIAKVFVNSKRVASKDTTKPDMFLINVTLHSYEIVP